MYNLLKKNVFLAFVLISIVCPYSGYGMSPDSRIPNPEKRCSQNFSSFLNAKTLLALLVSSLAIQSVNPVELRGVSKVQPLHNGGLIPVPDTFFHNQTHTPSLTPSQSPTVTGTPTLVNQTHGYNHTNGSLPERSNSSSSSSSKKSGAQAASHPHMLLLVGLLGLTVHHLF